VLFVKVANTSCQYPQRNVRGVAGTLWHPKKICWRIANTPWPCATSFQEGCQQPPIHFQDGCPKNIQRGNLFARPPKKVKVKVKTDKQ
jgi:hypothetical protein